MPSAFDALMQFVRPNLADPDRGLIERYAVAGDQEAFAALVDRHGPMVLGICRRVLRDPHRAEDAFQATFLVLARKAAKLHVDGSLASWLFGVARRVALAARRSDERQHRLPFRARSPVDSSGDRPPKSDWDDLLELLDLELARLPDKLRAPLLACYLNGRTQDEAARELGWSLSTLRRRLEQGRELLKVRLTARGAALSAGLFAGAIAPSARASVPESLKQSAAAIAIQGASVPKFIAEIAKEGVRMSAIMKWAVGLSLFVLCGVVAAVGIAQRPDKPKDEKPAKPKAAEVRRDRFNDPLPPRAIARMGTVGFHHPGWITSLSYAQGGKSLVSFGMGHVRVWDAETGQELAGRGGQYRVNEEFVETAQVSSDSRVVFLYGGRSNNPSNINEGYTPRFSVWNLETNKDLRTFRLNFRDSKDGTRFPNLVAPNGSAMAYVSYGQDIQLWDGSGKPTHVLSDAFPNMTGHAELPAVFTPDGKLLVTYDAAQTIKVWNVLSGKLVRSFGGGLPAASVAAISPDGKHFASFALKEVEGAALVGAAMPEKIRIWEIATGKLVREFDWEGEGWLMHRMLLQFAPDNQSIIAMNEPCMGDVKMRRWRINDGEQIGHWSIPGPNIDPRAIAIHPDGRTLALGNYFGIIRLFDLSTGKEKTSTESHSSAIESLTFAAASDELWTTGADRSFRRWETATGKPLNSWRLNESANSFSIAKKHILASRMPGKTAIQDVKILDPRTGAVQREILGIYPFLVAPDGKSIWAARRERNRLSQWDLDTGKALITFPIEPSRPIAAVDGNRLIITTDENSIFGWGSDGKRKFSWSLFERKLLRGDSNNWHDQVRTTAVSPDGRYIAVSVVRGGLVDSADMQSTYVCDLPTGKIVWQSKSVEITGDSLAYRPDGKVLAIGGRVIKLIDAMTGQQLAELDGHSFRVMGIVFSPDCKRLASGGFDGIAMVWDVSDINP